MCKAMASEPKITVRPPRHVGASAPAWHYHSLNRTVTDRFIAAFSAIKRAGKFVELLVGYYQRKQYFQRVECEFQQWQRQQQQ